MKKLTKPLALVLSVLLLLTLPIFALGVTEEITQRTSEQLGSAVITVTADEPTTAGQITITYDENEVNYISAEVETELYSLNDEEAGSIILVYSSLKPVTGTLATFTFECADEAVLSTAVKVESESFGNSDVPETDDTDVEITFHSCPSVAYTDLDITLWYHEAVDYVIENGIMLGVDDSTFDPNGGTTRAMFVTVLGRMAGVDTALYTGESFSDVVPGSWYAPYVQWAFENEIANGMGNDCFEPNRELSRQEMVTFLYRFAKWQGADVSEGSADSLSEFADGESVSGWAQEAFLWAVGNGIVNGTEIGLEPNAGSTRAQIAQLIVNYLSK